MMKYMPLFVDLHNRDILIIGAGKVALRRARQFSEAGAKLTVIAPDICEEFYKLPDTEFIRRGALPDDVTTRFVLALIATDNDEVNTSIATACQRLGLLFNRCDDFAKSNFINGTTLARGEIINSTVAGGVPAISKFIHQQLSKIITPELTELSQLLAELRPAIKASQLINGSKQDFIAGWVTEETLERLKIEGSEAIRQEILACL